MVNSAALFQTKRKVNGTLFLDKREASQLDYLTVNETAVDPPTPGDDPSTNINAPDRLSLEATMINQNFSQQILKAGNRKVGKEKGRRGGRLGYREY